METTQKNKPRKSPVIVLDRKLINSKAFKELTASAKDIFLQFCQKKQMKKMNATLGRAKEWVVLNNGDITFPYSEAEKKGFPRATFQRAIDQLMANGLIDIVHQGQGAGRTKDFSLYAFSERWKQYDTPEFKKVKRAKDKRKGRGFSRYWEKKNLDTGNIGDTRVGIKNDNQFKESIIKNDNQRKMARPKLEL
jgi:hypothetical protein